MSYNKRIYKLLEKAVLNAKDAKERIDATCALLTYMEAAALKAELDSEGHTCCKDEGHGPAA